MVNNSSILCYSSQPWSQVWILIIWNWPITFPSRLYNQAVPRRVLPICVMHPNTWPSLHRLARFYIYLFIKVSVLGILRHRCVTCWQNNFRSMPWSDSLYHPFLSLYYCGNVVLSYPFNTFTARVNDGVQRLSRWSKSNYVTIQMKSIWQCFHSAMLFSSILRVDNVKLAFRLISALNA